MEKPLAFISYRRDDEGPASKFVKAELDKIFGYGHIFMDIDSIRIGDNWKNKIESSIEACDCLIVVIGKNWLRLQDENYIRRLDKKSDWVRKEIETAISRNIRVIPLTMGMAMPTKEALPKSIRKLSEYQMLSLSALNWQNDITSLVELLCNEGFKRKDTPVEFPNPKGVKDLFPLALTEEELKVLLDGMDGWEITNSPIPGKSPKEMQEITKKYTFRKFEDVIGFMSKTTPFISQVQHHPRWENIWKSLLIHLTTWDIDYKVSKLDIEMAVFLDNEYRNFYKKL